MNTLRLQAGVFTLALAILLGCANSPTSHRPDPCLPHFPYQDGWLGGDSAYSISLPSDPLDPVPQRTLWLFGDSFVSNNREARDRAGAHFVHNTVAISHCTDTGFEIKYHWQHDAGGRPRAFIEPPESGEHQSYWWLFGGFIHAGALYLGILEVEPAPPQGPLRLPFQLTGMKMARIERPEASPESWSHTTVRLSESRHAFPAAAMVIREDHVYFFSFHAADSRLRSQFLVRLPLKILNSFPADMSDHLQTWTRPGQWQDGFLPDSAEPLMAHSASEMSVERGAHGDGWRAVYGFPAPARANHPEGGEETGAQADAVYTRTARTLEGPWSTPRILYRFPELSGAQHAPGTYCYAAKAHPQLAPVDQLLITYVCNLQSLPGQDALQTLRRLQKNMRLYRPRVILLPQNSRGELP